MDNKSLWLKHYIGALEIRIQFNQMMNKLSTFFVTQIDHLGTIFHIQSMGRHHTPNPSIFHHNANIEQYCEAAERKKPALAI